METVYTRQNHKQAITYLKASYYCSRKSDRLTYFIIFISVAICVFGIVNRYLVDLIKLFKINNADPAATRDTLATMINITSGIVLILTMVLSTIARRLQIESVNLMERYDAYVFDLPLNLTIMRPISDAVIELYSNRVRRKTHFFANFYYNDAGDAEARTACFDNQSKSFYTEYRLMLSVQTFFLALWIGFAIIVLAIAFSFNDRFISTLTNVLFPSLSIISLIVSSWYSFNEQTRALQNCINVLNNLSNPADRNRITTLTNATTLRGIQDGIFNVRLNSFTTPNFLVQMFEKKMVRESWSGGRHTREFISIGSDVNKRAKAKAEKKGESLDSALLKQIQSKTVINLPPDDVPTKTPIKKPEVKKAEIKTEPREIKKLENKITAPKQEIKKSEDKKILIKQEVKKTEDKKMPLSKDAKK